LYTQHIEEQVVPGKRLGRHVKHDPRSLQYAFKATGDTLVSKRWSTDSDLVLDQGDLGSCTGNATTGALICSHGNPIHDSLSDAQRSGLNESLAVKIYEQATATDGFPGQYPPTDTGSDGLDAAKAAKTFGYISGYTHALSLDDVLGALQHGPAIIGANWKTGFDNPSRDGQVQYTGTVRGGHEFCLDEIDVENQRVWFRNSWSASWGVNGRAWMSFDTLAAVLADQGDVTVFVPLSLPAPTPTPPTPTPTPEPSDDLATFVKALKHFLRKAEAFLENIV
jgi:hypothetical protein